MVTLRSVRDGDSSANGDGRADGASLQRALAEWQRSSEALRESINSLFEVFDRHATDMEKTQ